MPQWTAFRVLRHGCLLGRGACQRAPALAERHAERVRARPEAGRQELAFSPPSARACHRWGMRILVVDDDERLARAASAGFGRRLRRRHRRTTAKRALAGTENAYDAIVLDLMLPGLDGHEVCRRLRAAGNWTPILMLTAKVGVRDEATRSTAARTTSSPSRSRSSCCSPGSGHWSAAARASAPPCSRSATCGSTRPAPGLARRHADRADATAVLPARVPDAAAGRGRVEDA